MFLLVLLEVLLFLFMASVGVTQIIVPLLRGTKMFPYFRKEKILEERLQDQKQAEIEKNLKEKLKRRV